MSALGGLVDKGLVAPDWAEALAPVDEQIAAMGRFLREELAGGRRYLPAGDHVLRAFSRPLADVKVLIVGQDPYPTPGHPVGLSFSVAPGVAPPKSLVNIFKELVDDLGVPPPTSGDLTPWADAGVMLLNRSLTVTPGQSASHRGRGLGGGHRPGDPHALGAVEAGRAADRDPLGPRRPVAQARADRRSPGSSRCTRARCRRTAASSAPGRSAGSTGCWWSKGVRRWTGGFRDAGI